MNSRKVALISEEFPPFMFGGIASNCYDLAYSLSKKGIATTVLSGRSHTMTVEKLNSCLEVIRFPILNLPPRPLWFQLQNFSSILKLLRKFSVIHAVNPVASAMFACLTKKIRRPLVTSIHWLPIRDLKIFVSSPFSNWTTGEAGFNILEYPLNDLFLRLCLMNSNHIVVCGSTTLKQMKENYHNLNFKKVSVIPNGINIDKIDGVKGNSSNVDAKDLSLIFYGRLYWRKGILDLINAMEILRDDFPNVCLKIFGKGPLENKIKKLILKLKLKTHVDIKGHIAYPQLIEEIKNADVVALPSLYEVGPFVSALEAMACKKPVVTFDLPFTREFILDMYNGILVKPMDVKDLSNKIGLLLSDKNLRVKLGQNALNYVKKNHDWDSLVERYIQVYETIVKN